MWSDGARRDARVLLAECVRNEDVAAANYEAALRDALPDPVRELLELQFAAIKDAQRELVRAGAALG
jgi:hypothetical protein